MGTDERKLPGERILERLERRTRRRPRIGLVPEFYARLGVEDPWVEAGAEAGEGFVFLSGSPFYQALRRLANARRRRERRTERFLARRAGTAMRAATRRLPGERLALAPFGGPTLRDDAFRFFVPPSPITQPEPTVRVVSAWGGPATGERRSAWLETPYTAAKVAAPLMTAAGERLRRADSANKVDRALAASAVPVLPRARRALTQVVESEELLPARTLIRRIRRATPIVEEVVEAVAPRVRPVRVAATRTAGVGGAGLRPVLATSPSIALRADAALDRAMAVSQAAPERLEASTPAAARRIRASARAAARERVSRASPRLSASPVAATLAAARPATAPVSSEPGPRRASAAAAARFGRIEGESIVLEPVGLAARVQARSAPSAGGLLPRLPRPSLSMRLPTPVAATAATARTPDGLFVPARLVREAAARADAAEALSSVDLRPESGQAGARSFRTPSTSWAGARRGDAGASDVSPSPGHRTGSSAWEGARSGRGSTAPFVGARTAEASASDWTGASTARGSETPFAGAGVRRTAASSWSAAARAQTEGTPWEGATIGRRVDRAWGGAFAARTPDLGWEGARAGEAYASPWSGAPVRQTGASSWAAARLGDAPSSLLPRVSPAAPGLLLPRRAPEPESRVERPAPSGWLPNAAPPARVARTEATRFVAARVVRTNAGAGTPARVSEAEAGTVAASARAWRTPTLSTTAARVAARAPRALGTPVRVAGPLGHAAGPVSTLRALRTPDQAWASAKLAASAGPLELIHSVIDAVESASGPLGAVRTPDGRYVSARVARGLASAWAGAVAGRTAPTDWRGAPSAGTPDVAFTGAARARTTGSPFAGAFRIRTPDLAFARAALLRTPEGAWLPASAGVTPESPFDGAAVGRARPADWAGARSGLTEATAYRGALAARTPDARHVAASTARTPDGRFVGAASAATPATPFRGAGLGSPFPGIPSPAGTRRPATLPAMDDLSLPEREGGAPGTSPRRRVALGDTLGAVADGSVPGEAPSWASRATGEPRVRSGDSLFDALARADSPNEVVRIIFERAAGGRRAGPLPEPLVQVVQEIQREVVRIPSDHATLVTQRPIAVETPKVTTLSRSAPPRSTTRRVRSSAAPAQSTARVAGGRNDRLSKLVKRLNELIHLAENARLAEARRQVRLAEDTAAARAEGSAPLSGNSPDPRELERVDLEALSREVVHEVQRMLELNRERHAEDSDESNWW